jgi:ribosome biogenesis GTPase
MANQQDNKKLPEIAIPREGLVVAYFGHSVAVEVEDGQVFHCHLHRNQELPVVGDKVQWKPESENQGVVTAILPRSSLLSRGDGHGKMKPIAANIDVIAIVMAPPPVFSAYLLNRYLVASALLGIQPILVVNKIDLLPDAENTLKELLMPYRQLDYAVILTSVYLAGGLDELVLFLREKSAVLVGPSGVGKSSIIAKLAEDAVIPTSVVTHKGIGKHTTTGTRLYHLPKGGCLIDSPGVREFNLWPVAQADLLRGFSEFAAFLGECKFRDCQHLTEPGCRLREAAEQGKISRIRFDTYKILVKELSQRL